LVDDIFARHGIEAIVHAGALHKPDIVRYPAQAFIDVNVSGTLNLLEAAVAARLKHVVCTSTTSLMISRAIHEEKASAAFWLDEDFGPLEPRNIYGVTKLAAEQLCRLHAARDGLPVIVLRTSRFFPEEDDTIVGLRGENLKANEFLHRRLTVEDAARAHILALERAPELGFGIYIVSAPPPFTRDDVAELRADAPSVIARRFPEAAELYAKQGWQLPAKISRIYDPGRAERELGFTCRTDFAAILQALREGGPLPLIHDADYTSPLVVRL
jgi:nucleoside-diphosphate-sugar epimerase